jgi:hypothetical protein
VGIRLTEGNAVREEPKPSTTRIRRRAALRIVKSLALIIGYLALLVYVLACFMIDALQPK